MKAVWPNINTDMRIMNCINLCVPHVDGVVPNKPHICPRPWKGLDGICDRRGDMCQNNADCGKDGEKCCFNGCQNDCVKFGKSLDATYFTIQVHRTLLHCILIKHVLQLGN